MGLRKDLHIKALTEEPEIRERWKGVHGKYPDESDVDTLEHCGSLSGDDLARRLAFTRETLRKAGAHYVIDTFDQLPRVIKDVNKRLARGEKP